MLVDVHSHYMPAELAKALSRRADAPRIFQSDGERFIAYGEGSVTPLTTVFTDPDQILQRMDEAHIDHAVLSFFKLSLPVQGQR